MAVASIGKPSLADIPAQLRQVALDLEKGGYGKVPGALLILDCANGHLVVAGYGDADSYHALGLLSLAQTKLTTAQLNQRKAR